MHMCISTVGIKTRNTSQALVYKMYRSDLRFSRAVTVQLQLSIRNLQETQPLLAIPSKGNSARMLLFFQDIPNSLSECFSSCLKQGRVNLPQTSYLFHVASSNPPPLFIHFLNLRADLKFLVYGSSGS